MIPRLMRFLPSALCFVAGALSSFAMAPYNAWPVLFLGLSALYILTARTKSARAGFLNGWAFGFGYFLFGLYWIGNALLVEGNPYVWAQPLAVVGLPILLAFFPAAACGLARRFFDLMRPTGYLAFTLLLALFEFLRGTLFTGFPWNLFGYAWADMLPLIQVVSLGDIYLLTGLTILWAMLGGFLFVSAQPPLFRILTGLAVLLTFAGCYGFGTWRLNHYPPQDREDIRLKIVQPNIPQSEKWDGRRAMEHFFTHIRLSYPNDESDKTTYIVWPETALSYWLTEDEASMNILRQALSSYRGKAYLLTGLLRRDLQTGERANSLVMIDQHGAISNIYDKHHPVPFGEYIPFQKWIPLAPVANFSGFPKGTGPEILKTPEGVAYAPLICYEAIFPQTGTGMKADLLINTTNDAWYGDSPGPYQHFTQARFRAVESGVPLLRAANTGISGLIDPLGRIVFQEPLMKEGQKTLNFPEKIDALLKIPYRLPSLFFLFALFLIRYFTVKKQ